MYVRRWTVMYTQLTQIMLVSSILKQRGKRGYIHQMHVTLLKRVAETHIHVIHSNLL